MFTGNMCPYSLNILQNGMGGCFLRKTHISQAGTEPSYVAKFDLELLICRPHPTLSSHLLQVLELQLLSTAPSHLLESQFSVVMGGGANGEALRPPLKGRLMPVLGKRGPLRSGLLTKN